MNNKLRSVIEAITKWRDFFPIDFQETVPVMPYENAKQAQVDLIDAIIEEIPEIPDYDFLDASKSTEEKMLEGGERLGAHKYRQSVLNKLTQAREELSTSLTQ